MDSRHLKTRTVTDQKKECIKTVLPLIFTSSPNNFLLETKKAFLAELVKAMVLSTIGFKTLASSNLAERIIFVFFFLQSTIHHCFFVGVDSNECDNI